MNSEHEPMSDMDVEQQIFARLAKEDADIPVPVDLHHQLMSRLNQWNSAAIQASQDARDNTVQTSTVADRCSEPTSPTIRSGRFANKLIHFGGPAVFVAAIVLIAVTFVLPNGPGRPYALIERFDFTISQKETNMKSSNPSIVFNGDNFNIQVVVNTKLQHGWMYVISRDSAGLIGKFSLREDGKMEFHYSSHFDADPCYEYFVAIFSDTDSAALNERGNQPSWIPKPLYAELQSLGNLNASRQEISSRIEQALTDSNVNGAIIVDVKRVLHSSR